ncbi:Putative ribonuclease H protein At1g65750 [Linum perenne]
MQTELPLNPQCPVINFSDDEIISFYKPWSAQIIGITAWYLWRARNEAIFSNSSTRLAQLVLKITCWAKSVAEAFNREARCSVGRNVRQWREIAWEPGPPRWVTVNTDGSVHPSTRKAAAGGLIRDYEGRGLVAFTLNLGTGTITRAVIRAALTGLSLAWDYGHRLVELQIDFSATISILTSTDEPDHQYAAEVLQFCELCNRNWRVNIKHVYREANKAAYFLADQGFEFPFGVHLFPFSDPNFGHLLRYDCLGISEPRLILINE